MNVSPATTDDAPSILALQHLAYQTEAARYNDNTLPPLLEKNGFVRPGVGTDEGSIRFELSVR